MKKEFLILTIFSLVLLGSGIVSAECIEQDPSYSITPIYQEGTAGEELMYRLDIKNNDVDCDFRFFDLFNYAEFGIPIGWTIEDCHNDPSRCYWVGGGFWIFGANRYPNNSRHSQFILDSQEEVYVNRYISSQNDWTPKEYGHRIQLNYGVPGEVIYLDYYLIKNFTYDLINSEQDCSKPICGNGDAPHFTGEFSPNGCKVYVCPEADCSMPVCSDGEDPYFTGNVDSNGCKIYKCPEEDDTSEVDCAYPICENGEDPYFTGNVDSNGCKIYSCPEEDKVCPVGCECSNGVISCPDQEISESIDKTCPNGCVCENGLIICDNTETKGQENCAMGCKIAGNCVLQGTRNTIDNQRMYCDINSEWSEQRQGGEDCQNNYECLTNLCIDNECIDSGLWQSFIKWLKKLFS